MGSPRRLLAVRLVSRHIWRSVGYRMVITNCSKPTGNCFVLEQRRSNARDFPIPTNHSQLAHFHLVQLRRLFLVCCQRCKPEFYPRLAPPYIRALQSAPVRAPNQRGKARISMLRRCRLLIRVFSARIRVPRYPRLLVTSARRGVHPSLTQTTKAPILEITTSGKHGRRH